MSHTPGPWCWKEEGMLIKRPMVYSESDLPGVMVSDIVASVFKPADAELIVRACNSHEELLEACWDALLYIGRQPESHEGKALCWMLTGVLTKVEEQ